MARRRGIIAPKRNEFADAVAENVTAFQFYFDRMRNLCLSQYEWINLPETCSARHIERVLFQSGLAAFAYDERFGYISLAALPSKRLNMYNEAEGYRLNGIGYHKYFPLDECILIRNNLTATPTVWGVEQFAHRIAKALRTADINIDAQKTPILIVCDQKQKLTMRNVYMQYDGGYPVIYGDEKGFSPDSVRVLTTDAPYIADKMQDYIQTLWNDFLLWRGINSVGTEKKERLISDEVNANNEHTNLAESTGLLTRQQAAEALNADYYKRNGKYLDCSVRARTYGRDIDGEPEEEEPETEPQKGGAE